MTTASPSRTEHDVLIVGAGNAGVSLAAYLRRLRPDLDVAMVAPNEPHLYRPLLSYVGGGMASPRRLTRPQARCIPRGVGWYAERAVALSLEGDRAPGVRTATGGTYRGRDLVLCPGSTIDWDAIEGSREACLSAYGSTNYDPSLAAKTWRLLRAVRRGRAVFTISSQNTPCPGVGLKPLFLAADYWHRRGCLADIDITLIVQDRRPFGLEAVDRRILTRLDDLGVRTMLGATVTAVDAHERLVRAVDAAGAAIEAPYDVLHMTPPHRGWPWLRDTGLADPATGLLAVDPETLQHPAYPRVWALGDAAAVATPPSGGGLRKQVPVLAENLLAARDGGPMVGRYDGYTVAPVPLSRRRLVLGERARDGSERRTYRWVDLGKPRAVTLAFDVWAQPSIYWHRLLRGRL